MSGFLIFSLNVPCFLAIGFSNINWWEFLMQNNFNSFACTSLRLLFLQVVMKRLFFHFWKPFVLFSFFFNVNCLLMVYSVYHCCCFLKVIVGVKYWSCSLVAILVTDLCLWLVESGKHLSFWRCVQILHLVLKRCSDISERRCKHFSFCSLFWWV